MHGGTTVVFGIPVPSVDPVFIAVVRFHILVGIGCAAAGAIAMLSHKGRGRHSTFGTVYYWCLAVVVATATGLSVVRWAENYPLFILGVLSLICATVARTALRQRWCNWVKLHITGMGFSYVLMLTAFYVDNGKTLPLWKELPQIAFWLLPAALGIPLVLRTLLKCTPRNGRELQPHSLAKGWLAPVQAQVPGLAGRAASWAGWRPGVLAK